MRCDIIQWEPLKAKQSADATASLPAEIAPHQKWQTVAKWASGSQSLPTQLEPGCSDGGWRTLVTNKDGDGQDDSTVTDDDTSDMELQDTKE